MSTDRIILHSRIAPAFIEGMKDALKHSDDNSALPPTLVNAASKARVEAIVQNALASGAHLMHGSFNETGKTSPVSSIRMPALILGGVKENMTIWQEENFSSVASCMIVENDEEAIRIANTGGYGLSAAVFTEDLRKGLAIARKIQSG
jgi:acyl-CoA reductase-like NAD-dependent aldehyde dehydrogenase